MGWSNLKERDRIIVALDCSADEAVTLGEQLAGHAKWVKVGMTLYYAVGPAIVRTFHELGFKVFVDLKLHDIPHQVQGAANSVAAAGADLLTVHASGGVDMMEGAVRGAARAARDAGEEPPIICGITVLTSMDKAALESIGIDAEPLEQVKRLASLAQKSGLSGVVCSPQEAAAMRELLGPDAAIVTPGVRPTGAALGDQSRVASPAQAFQQGASHIVIGRPITQAADPVQAFEDIVTSL